MSSGEDRSADDWAQWRWIWRELGKRTYAPCAHVSFVIYFVVGMVVLGPFSVWVEIFDYFIPSAPIPSTGEATATISSLASLRTALMAFFPAVAATAAMQWIWTEGKELRAIAVLFLTVIAVGALLVYPKRITDSTAVFWAALLTVVTFWFWWMANAKNADLLGTVNPADSIGGNNPDRRLNGDLDGFET